MAIDRPDDFEDWISDAKEYGVVPPEAADWVEENFSGWSEVVEDMGIGYEAAIVGIDLGYDDPGGIESIVIHGDADGWSVEIDGQEVQMNVDDVWDWWDLATYYDIDIEKDIDTGEAGG